MIEKISILEANNAPVTARVIGAKNKHNDRSGRILFI